MNDDPLIKVYMVTHGPECYEIPEYCVPIEAGAALRDHFHYELRDDCTEDNVSEKNPEWCEVTALYWMWKHDRSDIVGLYHYRRMYRIKRAEIIKYLEKADMIATYADTELPMGEIFKHYCPSGSLEITLEQIKKTAPEDYETALDVLRSEWFYCSNLFVMSRKNFDEYCEWLFPLIFSIEKAVKEKRAGDPRYMGYIVEMILFNTFIRSRGWKVVHRNHCRFGRNSLIGKIQQSKIYGSTAMSRVKRRIPVKIRKIFIRCLEKGRIS